MLTRRSSIGLALSVTVVLAALHGLLPVIPKWVIGLPAWCAGLLIWPNANRRTRHPFLILGFLGLLTMAIGGGPIDLQFAIGGNALLIAMLAAVSFLRLVTWAEPESGKPAPRGRRAIWSTLLGVHLFGAVINLSVVFISKTDYRTLRAKAPAGANALVVAYCSANDQPSTH